MSTPPWRARKSNGKNTAYTAVAGSSSLGRPGLNTSTGTSMNSYLGIPGSSMGSSLSSSRSVPVNVPSSAPVYAPSSVPGYAPPQAPAEPKDKTQWPDSLKRFVARCFEEARPEERSEVENQLKMAITVAFEHNTTWSIDWDSKQLPVIEARRQAEAEAAVRTAKAKLKREKRSRNDSARVEMSAPSKVEKRLRRFESSPSPAPPPVPVVPVDINEPIIGRSTQLEKRYLRLTSAPDPESVRPLHILKQTLELLKRKWKTEQNYAYICDQFKSLRQDLTVQHIETEFTVQVYEIHARIALERSDLGEYNQCQSRLKELFDKDLSGHREEFLAYRILYLLHTQNRAEIAHVLATLDHAVRESPPVAHALQVSTALAAGNYSRLFRLYSTAPNMGGYVMDSFVPRERLKALASICRAYRPEIGTEFVIKELALGSVEECVDFLVKLGIDQHVSDNARLNTKDAYATVELARQTAFKKVDIKGQI